MWVKKMISRTLQIFVVVLISAVAIPIYSQPMTETRKGILIDANKPPVYLEFVRTGKCTKDFSNFNFGDLCDSKREDAKTFDAAWVRMVNNTTWSIGVTLEKGATEKNSVPVIIKSSTTVNQKGEQSAVGKNLAFDGGEMDVVYKSESETGCDFSKDAPKGQVCFRRETTVPVIPLPGLSTDLFIPSGKSIVFPIDRSHIKEYVNLFVLYNFEWEYSGARFSHPPHYDSQHRVYFGWFDLEKGLEKESTKKSK